MRTDGSWRPDTSVTPAADIGQKSQPPLLTTRSTGRLLAIGATKVACPSIFVVSGQRSSSLQTRDALPPGRTEDTAPVRGCWRGAADDRRDCRGSGAIHDVNSEVLPPIDPDLLWRRLSCECSIRQKGPIAFLDSDAIRHDQCLRVPAARSLTSRIKGRQRLGPECWRPPGWSVRRRVESCSGQIGTSPPQFPLATSRCAIQGRREPDFSLPSALLRGVDGTMTHTSELADGDLVVVEDRHCFFNGMFTVALWPDLMVVYHGPGLTRGQAQAHAVYVAASRGTFAWDLTFTPPERLEASLEIASSSRLSVTRRPGDRRRSDRRRSDHAGSESTRQGGRRSGDSQPSRSPRLSQNVGRERSR